MRPVGVSIEAPDEAARAGRVERTVIVPLADPELTDAVRTALGWLRDQGTPLIGGIEVQFGFITNGRSVSCIDRFGLREQVEAWRAAQLARADAAPEMTEERVEKATVEERVCMDGAEQYNANTVGAPAKSRGRRDCWWEPQEVERRFIAYQRHTVITPVRWASLGIATTPTARTAWATVGRWQRTDEPRAADRIIVTVHVPGVSGDAGASERDGGAF